MKNTLPLPVSFPCRAINRSAWIDRESKDQCDRSGHVHHLWRTASNRSNVSELCRIILRTVMFTTSPSLIPARKPIGKLNFACVSPRYRKTTNSPSILSTVAVISIVIPQMQYHSYLHLTDECHPCLEIRSTIGNTDFSIGIGITHDQEWNAYRQVIFRTMEF